jgi:hypothetical protein
MNSGQSDDDGIAFVPSSRSAAQAIPASAAEEADNSNYDLRCSIPHRCM